MVLNSSEVALGPVVARACVLAHKVAQTEELAKRRRAHSFDHAGLEEHRAWYVLATRGFVVKHVDAVKLRVVVAAVLAVAADAMLVHDLARRRSLKAGSPRQRKGGEERSNAKKSVWQFGTVKSSQVNTLPKAKSKTRIKQNKDMHKSSSFYSERGVPLTVLTSGGE